MDLFSGALSLLLSLTPKLIFFENGQASDQCTAFAVHRRYLVTAAHCLPTSWLRGEDNSSDTASAYFINRQENLSVRPYKIGLYLRKLNGTTSINHEEDWAILELSEPLQPSAKFFQTSKMSLSQLQTKKWSIVGYPYKANLEIEVNSSSQCHITSIDDSNLQTNCEGRPGMSGGPLFAIAKDAGFVFAGIINNIQLGKKKWLSAIRPSHSLKFEIKKINQLP